MRQKKIQTGAELLPDSETMERFVHSLLFRGLKTADTSISNRALSHWKKEGLLPQHADERKWVRLNLIEYVWLKMVEDLRHFGVSFTTIRRTKARLFNYSSLPDETLDTEENIKRSRQFVKDRLGYDDSKIDLGLNKMKQPNAEQLARAAHFNTALSNQIICALLLRRKTGIYIPFEGDPIFYWDSDAERLENDSRLEGPYVFLPTQHYLKNIWNSPVLEDKLTKLQLLNDDELMVLRAIRSNDFKEITIKPEKDPNKDQKINVTTITDGELTPEMQRQITNILGLKNYQSITLKKKSNSQIYFERKHTK